MNKSSINNIKTELKPNSEQKTSDVHQQAYSQCNVMRRQSWVCNSCGFSDYTDAVTEQELKEWLQCSNCGGDEFHLEPVIGGANTFVGGMCQVVNKSYENS